MSSPTPIASEREQPEKTPQCASCGSSLSGPFCSQCGEQLIDHHALTMKHFLSHGVVHEFMHLDGKIFRTFRLLLFRPGFLSAEYFDGRRRMYVNPIRLLLTAALIFALVVRGSYMSMNVGPLRLNLLPPGTPSGATIEETITKVDVLGILSRFAHWRGQTTDLASATATEKFHHQLKTYGTALSFCNVGLLALFLFVIYRRRRSLFLEHLVFSLHLASFVLLFSILSSWLFRLMFFVTRAHISSIAVFLIVLVVVGIEGFYVYRALLRFYQPKAKAVKKLKWWSWDAWATRAAVFAIFLANSVFITSTYAAGAAIALMRV